MANHGTPEPRVPAGFQLVDRFAWTPFTPAYVVRDISVFADPEYLSSQWRLAHFTAMVRRHKQVPGERVKIFLVFPEVHIDQIYGGLTKALATSGYHYHINYRLLLPTPNRPGARDQWYSGPELFEARSDIPDEPIREADVVVYDKRFFDDAFVYDMSYSWQALYEAIGARQVVPPNSADISAVLGSGTFCYKGETSYDTLILVENGPGDQLQYGHFDLHAIERVKDALYPH